MSSDSRKRKKKYLNHSNKKARRTSLFTTGMKGFLMTCNKREREAIKEAYNILELYQEKLYQAKQDEDGSDSSSEDDDDIESSLAKEVAALKSLKKAQRPFTQVPTGVNNVLFIRTTLPDPNQITAALFTDICQQRLAQSRFIMRFIPVLNTCKASTDQIRTLAREVLAQYFDERNVDGHSYAVIYKSRNSNLLSSKQVQELIWNVVIKMSIKNRVDLCKPDYIIHVNVIRSVCCLSVLKDYYKYSKYNLQEITVNHTIDKQVDNPRVDKETDNLRVDKETDNLRVDKETDDLRVDKETDGLRVDKETDNLGVDKETDDPRVDRETDDQMNDEKADNPITDNERIIDPETLGVADKIEEKDNSAPGGVKDCVASDDAAVAAACSDASVDDVVEVEIKDRINT